MRTRPVTALLALLLTVPTPAARAAEHPTRAVPGAPVVVQLELGTPPTSRQTAKARVDGAQSRLRARLAPSEQVLFSTHALVDAVVVRTTTDRVAALAALPGVVAVRPLAAKSRAALPADFIEIGATPRRVAPISMKSARHAEARHAEAPDAEAPDAEAAGAAVARLDPGLALARVDQAWAAGATGAGVRVGVVDGGVDTWNADLGGSAFPDDVVVGGTDLAGDAYDGGNDPQPDGDPDDCDGHGTLVAGLLGGRGVTTAGATYTGPYGTSLPPLAIAPGTAPAASLVAIRVFGCTGTTLLVSQALDLAADPDGDGDTADHLDVVNLSLGTDFGGPDDADSLAVDRASALGIVVVAAAGNGGDLPGAVSAPASAATALAVAATDDGHADLDVVPVVTAAGPGEDGGLLGEAGLGTADVSGTLVPLGVDGCDPLTAEQAAAVAGKVAGLTWAQDDAVRRCGSADRVRAAAAAGAVGVVLAADSPALQIGIAGSAQIPSVLLPAGSHALTEPGPVTVTFTRSGTAAHPVSTPASVDRVASFSAGGSVTEGKPDLAAPGVTSTGPGVGPAGAVHATAVTDSGTSMASPFVAGVAALVLQHHPGWAPADVRAALTSSADDLGDPLRTGSGRVDALAAVAATVLLGSGSFGVVPVTAGRVVTRDVAVTGPPGAHPVTVTGPFSGPAQVVVDATGHGVVTVAANVVPTDALLLGRLRVGGAGVPLVLQQRPAAGTVAAPQVVGGQALDVAGTATPGTRRAVLTLGGTSPRLTPCGDAPPCSHGPTDDTGDLLATGVGRIGGTVYVGVQLARPVPQQVDPVGVHVALLVDDDLVPDAYLEVRRVAPTSPHVEAVLVAANPQGVETLRVLGTMPLPQGDAPDSSTLLLPFDGALLPLGDRLAWSVTTLETVHGALVDELADASAPLRPTSIDADVPGPVPVAAAAGERLLVLHLQGGAEVVDVVAPTPPVLTGPTTLVTGQRATYTLTGGTAPLLVDGAPQPSFTVTLPAGRHVLGVDTAGGHAELTVEVGPAPSVVGLRGVPGPTGGRWAVTAVVRTVAPGAAPLVAHVRVLRDGVQLAEGVTGPDGTVPLVVPLVSGPQTVTVVLDGTASVAAATTSVRMSG